MNSFTVYKSYNQLPDVGTICELSQSCVRSHHSEYLVEGATVEVIAHFAVHGETPNVVAGVVKDEHGNGMVHQFVAQCLRPKMTPEEIEAEKKEIRLTSLLANYGTELHSAHQRSTQMTLLGNLYDAGYLRKD